METCSIVRKWIVASLFATMATQAAFVSAAPSGPRGYGLLTGHREVAAAVVNGAIDRCTDSDTGSAYYYLYLTSKIVDDMWEYLDWGGTVVLEITTQHTFTGDGELYYEENIEIAGPGIGGSYSKQESTSSPGRSAITREVFNHPITINDMGGVVAGEYLEVTIDSMAEGDLGPLCGQRVGGQAMWQARGAVIRLNP